MLEQHETCPDVIISDLSQARLGRRRAGIALRDFNTIGFEKKFADFLADAPLCPAFSFGLNPAEDNFLGELADRAGLNSTMKRLAASGIMRREYKNGGSAMAHPVKLRVIAGVPKDCNFWLEHDSWNGVCEELAVTVRGSSFEDAKRKMEAALQAHIENVLRKLLRKGGKRVA